jgi:hypothetical protein
MNFLWKFFSGACVWSLHSFSVSAYIMIHLRSMSGWCYLVSLAWHNILFFAFTCLHDHATDHVMCSNNFGLVSMNCVECFVAYSAYMLFLSLLDFSDSCSLMMSFICKNGMCEICGDLFLPYFPFLREKSRLTKLQCCPSVFCSQLLNQLSSFCKIYMNIMQFETVSTLYFLMSYINDSFTVAFWWEQHEYHLI